MVLLANPWIWLITNTHQINRIRLYSLMLWYLLLWSLIGSLNLSNIVIFAFIYNISTGFWLVLTCGHYSFLIYLHLEVFIGVCCILDGWVLGRLVCLKILNWSVVWIQLCFRSDRHSDILMRSKPIVFLL